VCEAWNDDAPADLPAIQERLVDVLHDINSQATTRHRPSVDMVRDWHRKVHSGLHIPEPYYAGEIRDSDPHFPCLNGYEVNIGSHSGLPSHEVPDALVAFQNGMILATGRIDAAIAPGVRSSREDELQAVLSLGATAHGEWIRIHPFANGNGRTARLLANWCLLRYAVPPILRVRPRPVGDAYARAAAASMDRNHVPMTQLLTRMLINFRDAGAI
jgi:fido (protein-threonine AMPylation protein)